MSRRLVVFRVICLFALAASIAVLVTNQFTNSLGIQTTFRDIFVYRYVLTTAVIGAAYAFIQMPLAVYFSFTEKRIIRHGFLQEFDFCGDKLPLASGVGAGFAYSFEQKRMLNQFFDLIICLGSSVSENDKDKFKKFLDLAIVASGFLALGFVYMAIISICSSVDPPAAQFGNDSLMYKESQNRPPFDGKQSVQ